MKKIHNGSLLGHIDGQREATDRCVSHFDIYTKQLCPCIATEKVGISIGYVLVPVH